MGLQTVKTTINTGATVFAKIDATALGGFSLDATGLTLGDTLPAGTAIIANEATRVATVVDADGDTPLGLLKNDVVIAAGAEIAVVTSGVVYARRIPAAAKTAAIKAKLPKITFSESF